MELSGDLQEKIKKYDEEPVYYCKDCLSLAVYDMAGLPYCNQCGSSDIETTDIHTWEKMYEEKYGKKNIIKKYNGEKGEYIKKGWL